MVKKSLEGELWKEILHETRYLVFSSTINTKSDFRSFTHQPEQARRPATRQDAAAGSEGRTYYSGLH